MGVRSTGKAAAAVASGNGVPAGNIFFCSPADPTTPGQTSFNFPLPATGHLRITEISNGAPGGSGASGPPGVVRSAGAPGGPGAKNTWIVPVEWLRTAYPGITSIYIDFGTLGVPGAGQNNANGVYGTQSSALSYRKNSSDGTLIRLLGSGTGGGNGSIGNATSATSAPTGIQQNGVSGVNFSGSQPSHSGGVAVPQAGNVLDGPTSGGCGGGLTAANVESVGAAGGKNFANWFSTQSGNAPVVGGVPGAGDGKPASNPFLGQAPVGGLGGTGGGSSNNSGVNGGNGADGTGYGASGGGGGAGTSGGTALSGAGGKGTWGCVQIETLNY